MNVFLASAECNIRVQVMSREGIWKGEEEMGRKREQIKQNKEEVRNS